MSSEIHDIYCSTEKSLLLTRTRQGFRVRAYEFEGQSEVWMRPLSDGSRAAVLFNRGKSPATVHVRWTDIGRNASDALPVRNLWKHQDSGTLKRGYSARVPAHSVIMIRVGVPDPNN